MPLYDFECDRGHVTESRQGFDTTSIPCRCGRLAGRVGVYRDQFIHAETGPKGGKRNEVPRDEIRLGQDVREYEEAVGEVAHAYSKIDDPTVKKPDYFKIAKQRAKKIMA